MIETYDLAKILANWEGICQMVEALRDTSLTASSASELSQGISQGCKAAMRLLTDVVQCGIHHNIWYCIYIV